MRILIIFCWILTIVLQVLLIPYWLISRITASVSIHGTRIRIEIEPILYTCNGRHSSLINLNALQLGIDQALIYYLVAVLIIAYSVVSFTPEVLEVSYAHIAWTTLVAVTIWNCCVLIWITLILAITHKWLLLLIITWLIAYKKISQIIKKIKKL